MLCVVLISASCLSAVWAWAEIPSARQQTKRRRPRAIWRLFFITDRSSEKGRANWPLCPVFPKVGAERVKAKRPVCPSLAPRLSFFQASHCDIENSSRLITRQLNRRSANYSDQFSNAYTGWQAVRRRER